MGEIADTIIKLLPLAGFAVGAVFLGRAMKGKYNGR